MYIKVYKSIPPFEHNSHHTHTFLFFYFFPFAMYLPNHLHAMPYRNTRKLFVNFTLSSDAYVAMSNFNKNRALAGQTPLHNV